MARRARTRHRGGGARRSSGTKITHSRKKCVGGADRSGNGEKLRSGLMAASSVAWAETDLRPPAPVAPPLRARRSSLPGRQIPTPDAEHRSAGPKSDGSHYSQSWGLGYVPPNVSKRVHLDRVVGRHRHHRDPDRPFAPRRPEGPRGGAAHRGPKQPAP